MIHALISNTLNNSLAGKNTSATGTYWSAGIIGLTIVVHVCPSRGVAAPGVAHDVDAVLLHKGCGIGSGGCEAEKGKGVEMHGFRAFWSLRLKRRVSGWVGG